MVNIEYKVDVQPIKDLTEDLKNRAKQMPTDSLNKFRSLTPIRSGNARRQTKLTQNTIVANYAYAERLDQGWSKQAPEGMLKPFERWFKSYVERTFRK